jgi:hypothetical protein
MTLRCNKHPLFSLFSSHIIEYPTPINLNYIWSFGSATGIYLVIQIITGIFLAMYYTSNINYAFLSIEFIMRNVNNGWIIRYLHANGASIFFIVVYYNILHGFYFGSYIQPKGLLLMSGVLFLILMMSNAFICYYFSLDDVKKNKKNEFSRNGLKVIGPLTFKFKNKSFYFKHIKIPSFISLRNCKHISELLGKFDIEAFSFFTKSQYSKNKAEILLNFIESLKEDEILNDFISFFSTKEILNFEQCYILEFCSPLLMRILSQGLLIELRNHNVIRNDFFIKLEKNLHFTKEEKKEFIFFLQKNINKVEDIIEFWVL